MTNALVIVLATLLPHKEVISVALPFAQKTTSGTEKVVRNLFTELLGDANEHLSLLPWSYLLTNQGFLSISHKTCPHAKQVRIRRQLSMSLNETLALYNLTYFATTDELVRESVTQHKK